MSQQKPPRKENPLNSYAKFSGIAIQMIIIIALGSYGGVKLDEAYPNKYRAFTICLSLASVAMAMYIAIRQGNRSSEDQDSRDA